MDSSRRTFIKISAAVASASLIGSCSRSLVSTPPLTALGSELDGRLIMPDETGYFLASRPNNSLYDDIRPIAVAMCANADDVRRCVKWARETGTDFAIRSGGHSYAGFSTTNGLLIDVKALNKVSLDLDNGLVRVDGGVNNEQLTSALRNNGVTVPKGRCPTVGIAALCLGGGWGFTATHLGLTCDSLVSTDLVGADDQIVTANEAENPDLFWALRGAGGGNFGVNTSLVFKLHEVSRVTRFNIIWPPGRQVELMSLLQDLQIENATNLSTRSKVMMTSAKAHPTLDDLATETIGQYFGSAKDFREIIQPAVNLHKPHVLEFFDEGYWQAQDALQVDDPHGLYDIRSYYLEPKLSDIGLATMIDWMTRWPGGALRQINMGLLMAIGGRVRNVNPESTAYVHRKSNFVYQLEATWSPIDDPDVVRKQREWLSDYYNDMQRFTQPSSYQNFPSRELEDWKNHYYGSNFPRLVEIKGRYDRDNLFKFEQSIPVK